MAPVLEKGGFNFREGDDTPYPWCAYRGTDRGEQSALALKASMVMPFEARTTQADSLFLMTFRVIFSFLELFSSFDVSVHLALMPL